MRYCFIAFIATVITALDQYTKHLIISAMGQMDVWPVTGFLNIVHVRNHGAAFGFLNNPDTAWQLWVFIGATLLALGVIVYLAKTATADSYMLFTGLGFISGGAIGNCIDRVARGSVVDFLDVHYAGWHWPAFNIADIAICIGAALILFLMLFPSGKQKNKEV